VEAPDIEILAILIFMAEILGFFKNEIESPDITDRIRALSHLEHVLRVLPQEQRDAEVLPLILAEIQEASDESVLLELARVLPSLCGLWPLESIFALYQPLMETDESVVRESAVKSLTEFAANLENDEKNLTDFKSLFLQSLKQLHSDSWFAGKISAAQATAALFNLIPDTYAEDFAKGFLQLLTDETPLVRRAAAAKLPVLIKNFSFRSIAEDMILNELKKIASDGTDEILRIYALQTVCCLVTEKFAISTVKLILEKAQEDPSWRVRSHFARLLPTLIHPKPASKDLEMILSKSVICLLRDVEWEVREAMVKHINKELLTLSKSEIETELEFLLADAMVSVRVATIKIIPLINPDKKHLYLSNALLKDENSSVKVEAIKSLVQIILNQKSAASSSFESADSLLLQTMKSNVSQWRVKFCILQQLPLISSISEQTTKLVFEIVLLGLSDSVFQVREESVRILPEIVNASSGDTGNFLNSILLPKLNDLYKNGNYLSRVTVLHAISMLAGNLSEEIIHPIVEKSLDDLVPNVVLAGIQVITKLPKNTRNYSDKIRSISQTHMDADVQFAASNTFNNANTIIA
jgi:serine/threonine-protein phosphatase 2A regulatory subunit A